MSPQPLLDNDRYEQFVLLFTRSQPALLSYVLSMLPRWSDAEDVVQQTSLVLWRKFDEFQPGTDFVSWACQIAKYKVLNYRRQIGRDRHVFCEALLHVLADEGVADLERLEAERHALRQCLNRLDRSERDLIEQCYAEGSVIKQVAERRGDLPSRLYKRLDRIRAALLRCIEAALAREGEHDL